MNDDSIICPHCNGDAVVGVEVRGVYDGVLFWKCTLCHGSWHRFSKKHDSDLRLKAEPYIHGPTKDRDA